MKRVFTVLSQQGRGVALSAMASLHGGRGNTGSLKHTRIKIARLTMAVMFFAASPAVHAQQVAEVVASTPPPASTVQSSIPKKTIEQKAVIAAAALAAGLAAFKAAKATTQSSVNPEPPAHPPQAATK